MTTSLNSYYHRFFLTLTPNVGEYVVKNKDQIIEKETQHFGSYSPNKTEKFGDGMLLPMTSIPKIFGCLKNPSAQVVAGAVALVALIVIVAYPTAILNFAGKGFHLVVNTINLNPEYTKLVVIVSVIYPIIGWGVRGVGRFHNPAFDKIFGRAAPKPLPEVPGDKKEGT